MASDAHASDKRHICMELGVLNGVLSPTISHRLACLGLLSYVRESL